MRLKKETHTDEYYVYDCPLCGKETEWNIPLGIRDVSPRKDEPEPTCYDCRCKLTTCMGYKENEYLLGAVISDLEVDGHDLQSFNITALDGKKYRVDTCWDYDGGSELDIEEIKED